MANGQVTPALRVRGALARRATPWYRLPAHEDGEGVEVGLRSMMVDKVLRLAPLPSQLPGGRQHNRNLKGQSNAHLSFQP